MANTGSISQDTGRRLTAAGNEISASYEEAKRRSDKTLQKLHEDPGKFTMLTGTGRPDACIWGIISGRSLSA